VYLLTDAELYSPDYKGVKDVLIAGSQVDSLVHIIGGW